MNPKFEDEMFPKLFWDEYVSSQTCYIDSWEEVEKEKDYLNLIKNFLDTHPKYQGCSGEEVQDSYNYFEDIFNFPLQCSWRGWGDLMSAYMNSKHLDRRYHYLDFYMRK